VIKIKKKTIGSILIILVLFSAFTYFAVKGFKQESIWSGYQCKTQTTCTTFSACNKACDEYEAQGLDCYVDKELSISGDYYMYIACANEYGEEPSRCIAGFTDNYECRDGDVKRRYINYDCSEDWRIYQSCASDEECENAQCVKKIQCSNPTGDLGDIDHRWESEACYEYECKSAGWEKQSKVFSSFCGREEEKEKELPEEPECSKDYNCDSDEYCSNGECLKLECKENEYPVNHICEKKELCATNLDCKEGEVCSRGLCILPEEEISFLANWGVPIGLLSLIFVVIVILVLGRNKKKKKK